MQHLFHFHSSLDIWPRHFFFALFCIPSAFFVGLLESTTQKILAVTFFPSQITLTRSLLRIIWKRVTLSFPMFPFDPPATIRKPLIYEFTVKMYFNFIITP